ncbi:MAG: Rid family detoxifying hydrolase [Flavobacteriaceae bacterium]|nr:Rid family detoxifying hydrolase [Flavobacteriaceae bacterium]
MKKIIHTKNAPTPIGPYSQAVLNNNILYTSGQIAFDPFSGELKMNSIIEETAMVMENLKAVLTEAEMTFDNVFKVSIFITNMNDFAAINEVYATYFDENNAPARETVQVAALPKNVNIEISMMASL